MRYLKEKNDNTMNYTINKQTSANKRTQLSLLEMQLTCWPVGENGGDVCDVLGCVEVILV